MICRMIHLVIALVLFSQGVYALSASLSLASSIYTDVVSSTIISDDAQIMLG